MREPVICNMGHKKFTRHRPIFQHEGVVGWFVKCRGKVVKVYAHPRWDDLTQVGRTEEEAEKYLFDRYGAPESV